MSMPECRGTRQCRRRAQKQDPLRSGVSHGDGSDPSTSSTIHILENILFFKRIMALLSSGLQRVRSSRSWRRRQRERPRAGGGAQRQSNLWEYPPQPAGAVPAPNLDPGRTETRFASAALKFQPRSNLNQSHFNCSQPRLYQT